MQEIGRSLGAGLAAGVNCGIGSIWRRANWRGASTGRQAGYHGDWRWWRRFRAEVRKTGASGTHCSQHSHESSRAVRRAPIAGTGTRFCMWEKAEFTTGKRWRFKQVGGGAS